MLLCLEATGGSWVSFKESRVGPGAWGGSGSSEPPRRPETGVKDEGEGEAKADSL